MKSKHFDTIIMGDLVRVTPTQSSAESEKMAKQIEKLLAYEMKRHAEDIEALIFSTQWGNDPVLPNPDYEAAKDLIREVVSAQDQETQSP